jgi:primosomal protein N' (replication factor Y)
MTDTVQNRNVAVGVPVPGLGLLTYRVPAGMPMPSKGARVTVPLGTREVTGCVVDLAAEAPDPGKLKDVRQVLDTEPFLPPLVVDLALWAGEYYASGPGDALAVAMPPGARRARKTTFRTVRVAELTPAAASLDLETLKGDRQRTAVALLRERPEGMTLPALSKAGVGPETLRSLARRGVVLFRDDVVERDPFGGAEGPTGAGRWAYGAGDPDDRGLTPEQAAALESLESEAQASTFRTILLHGVTGSGKTELYLRLARFVIRSGRRVLVLVPEIALTPAAAGLFRGRFGSRVAIQHSGLSDGERHDQWHRIRRGDVDVVVGTRSAVFTPLTGVGLIVVDEEHDGSYKQDESPRYHGRDVAIVRGQMEQALVVLGTATPSLESAANAKSGRYGSIVLTRRIFDRPMATVSIVDMRLEYAALGPDVTLSRPLIDALETRLRVKEQSLVLLNRRGFATVIFCRQCGSSMECPHCSVSLTYHRAARRLQCHYCNYSAQVPKACPQCTGAFLEQSGFGTERLEAELRQRFPTARVARVDRDTIRRRGAIAKVLNDVGRGRIDILVGTQMIAKGHDFPAVTLVGVVSADVGLGLADFRAAERTFQLITQVVGRSGRGETPGDAIVQTISPDHYSIRAAAAQDYAAFFAKEMDFRTHLHYPPAVALISTIVKGRSLDEAMTDALDLVKRVRRHGSYGKVLGPAPAALAKIKDEYRAQFFVKVKGAQRTAMRRALQTALEERPDLKRRTIVDVDPINVL